MPQIEVSFDIDANGVLNVSAKDKKTGKEQAITIKGSSGLSEEEVQRMVRDAEAHAEEDKVFQEKVSARNNAESMLHSIEKAVAELGDDVTAAEKSAIDDASKALKDAMDNGSVEDINNKSEALMNAAGSVMQKAYNKANGDSAGAAAGASAGGNSDSAPKDDNVVDADFQEVKDDK
jgi:hypothetical protein